MKWLAAMTGRLKQQTSSARARYAALLHRATEEDSLSGTDQAKLQELCLELGISPEQLADDARTIVRWRDAGSGLDGLAALTTELASTDAAIAELLAERQQFLEKSRTRGQELQALRDSLAGQKENLEGKSRDVEAMTAQHPDLFNQAG